MRCSHRGAPLILARRLSVSSVGWHLVVGKVWLRLKVLRFCLKQDQPMNKNRRNLLKRLGQGGLGLGSAAVLAGAVSDGRSVVVEGREALEHEIKALRTQLNKLDGRTKLLIKVLAISVGLDLVSDFAVLSLKQPV